jgi:hypothetical protein
MPAFDVPPGELLNRAKKNPEVLRGSFLPCHLPPEKWFCRKKRSPERPTRTQTEVIEQAIDLPVNAFKRMPATCERRLYCLSLYGHFGDVFSHDTCSYSSVATGAFWQNKQTLH